MDFRRQWTQFALEAEVEHCGTSRIAKAGNALQSEVKRLRAVLEEVRAFSTAHHSDEKSHAWLHAFVVDIPHMVDTALKEDG